MGIRFFPALTLNPRNCIIFKFTLRHISILLNSKEKYLMSENNPEQLIQVLGMLSLAVVTAFVGIRKLLKDWNTDNAETSVINIMHEELERMSKQNTLLATELNKLQLEIVSLNRELHKLNLENQRLQLEVVALTREVTRLQTMLHTGDLNVSTN